MIYSLVKMCKLTDIQKLALNNKYSVIISQYDELLFVSLHKKIINEILNIYPIAIQFNAKILPKLNNDFCYRNMFETKYSNATNSLNKRIEWENKLFNNCYNNIHPKYRVKYGFLFEINNTRMQFGDSLIILKNNIKNRCTMTLGDSSNDLCKLYSFSDIVSFLHDKQCKYDNSKQTWSFNCYYSDYIEVQIHGPIILNRDISKIIINNKYYQNKEINNIAQDFCDKNNCLLEWTK